MMFSFFNLVTAIYLYNDFAKKFVGITRKPDFHDAYIILENNKQNAIDFKFYRSGPVPRTYTPHLNLSEIVNLAANHSFRIMDPKARTSLDWCSCNGKVNNRVILYRNLVSKFQEYKLDRLKDGSYVFKIDGRCSIYNESKDYFELGSCDTNLKRSSFRMFTNLSDIKKKKTPKNTFRKSQINSHLDGNRNYDTKIDFSSKRKSNSKNYKKNKKDYESSDSDTVDSDYENYLNYLKYKKQYKKSRNVNN